MKQRIINIIAAAVILALGTCIVIGAFPYWMNYVSMFCIIPACIAVTDITEWAHPEFFGEEEEDV